MIFIKKILILFFILFISIFIYFKFCNENKNVLYVGKNIFISNKKLKYIIYPYDYVSYKDLIESIDSNEYRYIKGKNVFLNNLIYKANKIIINVNDECNYIKTNNDSIIKLISKIRKISNAKLYFIKNNCSDYLDFSADYVDFIDINTIKNDIN